MMLVDADTGAHLWTKEFNSGATNPELIFNECWGGHVSSDGTFYIGCGVGIGNCDKTTQSAQLYAECLAGGGDNRTGAVRRGAAVWRSMLVGIDRNGTNVIWRRVDQWKAAESAKADAEH